MKMDIQVDGLDRLRRNLGNGAKTLDAELRPSVRRSGEVVRTEAKRLAVGNRLPNSVQMRSLNGGLTEIVGSVAKTAASIEKGRHKGERVSVGLLTGWINRRGIVSSGAAAAGAVQSIKTHAVSSRGTKSARSRSITRAQRDLAWKIALAIREHGTRPLPFIIPAGKHKLPEVQSLIRAGVGRALKRIAH